MCLRCNPFYCVLGALRYRRRWFRMHEHYPECKPLYCRLRDIEKQKEE